MTNSSTSSFINEEQHNIELSSMSTNSNSSGSSILSLIEDIDDIPTTPTTDTTIEDTKPPRQIIKELTIEVLPALLVSVAGSVLAGYILGKIQQTPAFIEVSALFIMVPVLLNLKSNIELNMSTRLSTMANLGMFDNRTEGRGALRSNLELLLLQSSIVGLSVGTITVVLSLIPHSNVKEDAVRRTAGEFVMQSIWLMATGIGTAMVGSSMIGSLIGVTVWASHRLGVDPDNIGTPIASSFGDMSTLLILSLLTTILLPQLNTIWPILVFLAFIGLGILLFRVVNANQQMSHHIREGWPPLVYAAITASVAGVVVEKCADRYPAMPALVPVLNGIGGNIGTVFASRLSTSLHRSSLAVNRSKEHNLVMLILLAINIPVQVGFLAMHRILDPSLHATMGFFIIYTTATIVHGLAMLLLARFFCNYLWKRGYDPDDYVNPFITGTGDMLGTLLLALVFILKNL